MTPTEISQKMLDVFFRHKDISDLDSTEELNKERSFDLDEFDELMSDVVSEFDVNIPVKPVKYAYAPPGIDKRKFKIQQLSDYVETLLNKQES